MNFTIQNISQYPSNIPECAVNSTQFVYELNRSISFIRDNNFYFLISVIFYTLFSVLYFNFYDNLKKYKKLNWVLGLVQSFLATFLTGWVLMYLFGYMVW